MSTSRPKLKLDEQSFQDMLSAAFTIQEHNAKRKRALHPVHVCEKCGTAVNEGELLCGRCGGGELRPGEDLQRKWASLWLMSQDQGLFPEHSVDERKVAPPPVPALRISEAPPGIEMSEEAHPVIHEKADEEWPGTALADLNVSAPPEALETEPEADVDVAFPEESISDAPSSADLRDLRLKLRFHRADLYLVVAIIVSTFAMFWVLLATPASGARQKPRLRPWERALVTMGLAEAPEPPPRRGDPSIQVWVDPRSALYYCAGEDQYGKTPGGRSTTQGEAQMDQFEPASRAACE